MKLTQFNQAFFDFLQKCPTPFHTAESLCSCFHNAGFKRLRERDEWILEKNHGYYCIRDDGSLVSFTLAPDTSRNAPWRMTGSHTDSPSLQIKPIPLKNSHAIEQLCVEVYGGPLLATWFDRDLGIAGRVTIKEEDGTLSSHLIDFKRPLAIIPSLAIHLDRNANKEHTIGKQKHLYPLLCQDTNDELSFSDTLSAQLAKEHPAVSIRKILGFDLFCYDTQPPAMIGLHNDFIAASRLDNLVSCFAGASALLQQKTVGNCLLLCSNHEEIGSASVAGARGNFLSTVLDRLLPDAVARGMSLHDSCFISLDNAHAVHPNFSDRHDPQHQPLLNHGPVIKYNSNQRYATTSRSAGFYKMIAEEAAVPVQEFVMNNDMACGSTIGPITATRFGIQTVDVGVPSLAMHSIRETTGRHDPYMLYQTICQFYSRPTLPKQRD